MDFFLDFEFCKSVAGEERDGNYVFQVEASNENIDFQDQIVLQDALLKSKDNFLKNGVISYDHLHRRKDQDGNMISDPSMIIGEPIDVWTDGNKTFVKGILYKANEMAQEVVKLLKSGSTRIRASVGGLFPEIVKGKDGVERIVSVLWNDLALTPCPVNNTVSAASFAKSFTPETFARALAAGAETDGASKTGGAALIQEDLDKNDKDVVLEEDEVEKESPDEVLKSMLGMIEQGAVDDKIGIYDFLVSKGIDKAESWAAAHEIDNILGGYNAMEKRAGSFVDQVKALFKSMEAEDDADELDKAEDEGDMELDLEVKDDGGKSGPDDGEDDGEDDEMQKGKSCKKSYIDATDILKSLSDDLAVISKENEALRKSVSDLGDAVVEIAKAVTQNSIMVKSLAEEPVGIRAKMEKSMGTPAGGKKAMTQSDFKWAQGVLVKAVKDGEIDIAKSAMIERDLQLAMASPGYQMNPEYYNFLSKKFAGGN